MCMSPTWTASFDPDRIRRVVRTEKGKDMEQQEHVRLYTLSTCSHCKAAKKLLKDYGVEFEFTDVDLLRGEEQAAAIRDVKKINPRCSFPTIIIGDRVIIGNRQDEIKEALGLS
jgi:glutaredoxin-like protein NrdH